MKLHLDFETRSKVDIKDGYDLYARNAEVLMLGFAFDDGPVNLWLPEGSGVCHCGDQMEGHLVWDNHAATEMRVPLPTGLRIALSNPAVTKVAWNAPFERSVFLHCLGIDIPREQWFDPKLMSRYGSMGAHLSDASDNLGYDSDAGKDKVGKRLIDFFCKPISSGKRKGEFRDPKDHPLEWEQFKEYCKQDIVAERNATRDLAVHYSLPERERKIALLDWKINERGLPMDMKFVTENHILVNAEKARLMQVFKDHTGLENPNSTQQLLPWLKERGYPYASLEEAKVKSAMLIGMTPEVTRALKLRMATSRSSTSKLATALKRVSADARARWMYTYYGAHTGRWSGVGIQPQNLPRNEVEIGFDEN